MTPLNENDAASTVGPRDLCSTDEVTHAILRHAADFFEEEINFAEMKPSQDFLSGKGMVVGSRTLDSLDTLSLFGSIEDEIGVSLLDVDDIGEISSLEKVSAFIIAAADPAQLARFCLRWSHQP